MKNWFRKPPPPAKTAALQTCRQTEDSFARFPAPLRPPEAGLYEGLPLPRVMERASAAAALAITRKGAAPSIPTKEEVTRYLKEAT